MRKGKRKLNQAGMSLVELIIVIVIMGILSVGSAIGISYVSKMNSTSAAEKIQSMLERTRLTTLSSDSEVKMVLGKDSDGFYCKLVDGTNEVEKVKLGGDALTITANPEYGTGTSIGSSSCEFRYNKSNGAFQAGSYVSIVITGSKTKTVRLVTATGRTYIE